jgi:hypothetical protein
MTPIISYIQYRCTVSDIIIAKTVFFFEIAPEFRYWNFKLWYNLENMFKDICKKFNLKFVTVVIIFDFEILAINLAIAETHKIW